jgi:hypothetical protein
MPLDPHRQETSQEAFDKFLKRITIIPTVHWTEKFFFDCLVPDMDVTLRYGDTKGVQTHTVVVHHMYEHGDRNVFTVAFDWDTGVVSAIDKVE